ncbi:hypothetical protein D3C86_1696900 [compost metagenome]
MVINKESLIVVFSTEIAFAHTVPFVSAVTNPLVAIVAVPVPFTMLQVTSWFAAAGRMIACVCNVPPLVVIAAVTLF